MIRSMTGYGTASLELAGGTIRAEARSVNSRHLKLVLRGPARVEAWEPEIRAALADAVRRGRLDVWITVEDGPQTSAWEVDHDRVSAYVATLRELADRHDLPGEIDLALISQTSGLLREAEDGPGADLILDEVLAVARSAVDGLVEMREAEGRRLDVDLRERIAALRHGLAGVEELAPERLTRERDRLRAAVTELTAGAEFDQDRIAREIALIADRWDLGEEIVRARAHLDAFDEYLAAPSEEPVGKRLSFLVQELHREINTTGAKANDIRISRQVVEMKNEIEKLREQVENVE